MTIRRMALAAISVVAAVALAAATPVGAVVPGTSPWRVRGARDRGPMKPRRMTFTLVLAPRHPAALRKLDSSPHRALTPAQFMARFAPSKATVGSVRRWAKAHRMRVLSVSKNRTLVRLSGSSTSIGSALLTSFRVFHSGRSGTFFQIARRARLPGSLAPQVSAVLGLSSLPRLSVPRPAQRSAAGLATVEHTLSTLGLSAATLSYPAEYGPKAFWSMYHAPSSQTGRGQQLAIITEGKLAQPKKDLATFERRFGLRTVTWRQINVGAATRDTSGDDEWDLDSQYSTGFAPGVGRLDVYVGQSLSDQDIERTINRWITDDISKQGSFSAGECELLSYAGGFMSGLDTILEQAVAQGQTMFFASGDTGSQCPALVGVNGVPAGIPGVSYPASTPYGIGVGGTSVLSPSGPTEIAWYAAGGGTSLVEPTPAFQSSTRLAGIAPLPRRGVPDVSLDADPESGYDVVVNGTVQVAGGTSASAPSWQGIWARAQGAHRGSLGFAGPVIYNTEPERAFQDITLGSNGFPALPGWDYASGRGTAQISNFVGGA